MTKAESTNPETPRHAAQQVVDVAIGAGAFSLRAHVAVTPRGLLAIAALVSGILLSTALLVREARK